MPSSSGVKKSGDVVYILNSTLYTKVVVKCYYEDEAQSLPDLVITPSSLTTLGCGSSCFISSTSDNRSRRWASGELAVNCNVGGKFSL